MHLAYHDVSRDLHRNSGYAIAGSMFVAAISDKISSSSASTPTQMAGCDPDSSHRRDKLVCCLPDLMPDTVHVEYSTHPHSPHVQMGNRKPGFFY